METDITVSAHRIGLCHAERHLIFQFTFLLKVFLTGNNIVGLTDDTVGIDPGYLGSPCATGSHMLPVHERATHISLHKIVAHILTHTLSEVGLIPWLSVEEHEIVKEAVLTIHALHGTVGCGAHFVYIIGNAFRAFIGNRLEIQIIAGAGGHRKSHRHRSKSLHYIFSFHFFNLFRIRISL